jgi:hypothetical protein
MKTQATILLFGLMAVLTACSTSKTTAPPVQEKAVQKESLDLQRPIPYPVEEPWYFEQAVKEGTRTESGKPGPDYFTNYAKYKLNAELSPADTMLYGQADITYINNSPDTLNYLLFELTQNLHKEGVPRNEFAEITGGIHITRISIGGEDLQEVSRFQKGYVVQGTNMIVLPGTRINPNEQINLEVEWNFKIPRAGASARMGYNSDNLFFLGYWFPHVSTYDDLFGWFGDNFTGNAEFYHDFGDYDISITAPEQWLVMSTGEFENPAEVLAPSILKKYNAAQTSDEVMTIASFDDIGNTTVRGKDGTLTWKFKAKNVPDVAFSATRESQWDALRTPVGDTDGDGQTNYSMIHSFWRSSAPLWEKSAEYTAHAISYLSKYTGLSYPWPHMSSVEGAGIIGGGMEYPMITLIGAYNNPNPSIPMARKQQALYDVTAHEIAHMWIPMVVSSNERRNAWLDEGSTTFHEAHARWDKFPDSFDRLDEFSRYTRIAGTYLEGEIMRWSDYHYPGPAYGTASYPKPASVLIALHGVLGDEVFTKGWHAFMKRWAYKHPTPYDLFNTFEDVSGKDLSWFWRSWYFETWALDQSISDVTQADGKATITIEDLGKVPMPVDLTITFSDGTTSTTRISVDDWLMGKRFTSTTIDAPSIITSVEIDADHFYPDVDRSNNKWTN